MSALIRSIRRWPACALALALGVMFALAGSAAWADEVPLDLKAERLFISSDGDRIEASGAVDAQLENLHLLADELILERTSETDWSLEAHGGVQFAFEDTLTLSGDRLAASVAIDGGGLRATSLSIEAFGGQSRFDNSQDEEQTLYFLGERGTITFDASGEASLIEVFDAEVTTCSCCELPFQSQPYTLGADRLQLHPDRLLVAFGLTARLGGVPAFWFPVYVQPLEETLESPLFPAIGRSGTRGWFLKWGVPYYVSDGLFGTVLLDYYSAHDEVGAGIVTRYEIAGHEGRLRLYHFPVKVGDSIFEFSARHALPPGAVWSGSGSIDLRVVGDTTTLDYGAEARGASGGWDVTVSATREVEEQEDVEQDREGDLDERETLITTTDRAPEIRISRKAWGLGGLELAPRFDVGLFREQSQTEPAVAATRLSSRLGVTAGTWTYGGLRLTPRLDLRASAYLGDDIAETQNSIGLRAGATWGDVTADYALSWVQGRSPFDFDSEVATHRIGVTIDRRGWADLRLSTGFDWAAGTPDPLIGRLDWLFGADWTLEATYDFAISALESIELSGSWDVQSASLTWSIPYDVSVGAFDDIVSMLDLPGESIELSVEVTLAEGRVDVETTAAAAFDLDPVSFEGEVRFRNVQPAKASLSAETKWGSWGGRIGWDYSGGAARLGKIRFGLFRDFGGCLRVGIDREASDTWIYISVLAFPEAILRYAPASSRIETGD